MSVPVSCAELLTNLRGMRQAAFVNLSEQLGLDGCKQLAEELKSRECTLQSIVAYWNSIDSAGAAVICDALAINSSVTKLNLWANTIDDVGAMAFASLIRRETVPLRELDLSRNNIGVGGIRAICEALRFNSSITYLDICGNYATVQQEWLDDMFASNFALQHLFSDFDPERQPQVVEAKLNRNKNLTWDVVHEHIVDICIAFSSLNLSPYVLLWIIDWLPFYERTASHIKKIRLIERVLSCCENVRTRNNI